MKLLLFCVQNTNITIFEFDNKLVLHLLIIFGAEKNIISYDYYHYYCFYHWLYLHHT